MYIPGLIPRNFSELTKAIPIAAFAGSSEALLLADDIITKILCIGFYFNDFLTISFMNIHARLHTL